MSETIYGDPLPTISVPSSVLKKGNLEILISSIGPEAVSSAGSDADVVTADSIFVPTIPVRSSQHQTDHNTIRYPVHRTLVCGSGVDGILAYGGLVSRAALKKGEGSVFASIELPVGNRYKYNGPVAFVDIDAATAALGKFRESVENASDYERGWNHSGVQNVLEWLLSTERSDRALDPDLERLIASFLDTAEESVHAQEAKKLADREAQTVPDKVRSILDLVVSAWAERAHTELRQSLEEGFSSKRWGGLAWWKLFWRVDDVGMITSEILKLSYLRRAERECIWTSGRLQQAGLLNQTQESTVSPSKTRIEEAAQETDNDKSRTTSSSPEAPWPTQISRSRDQLVRVNAPSLQALAQRLVLYSISTTTLTSAISVLSYVSFPTASVYESCTLAALGLIYSLRRQQKRWAPARTLWEDEVRETGRTSLKETEEELRTSIRQGGKPVEPLENNSEEQVEKIKKARRALEEVK